MVFLSMFKAKFSNVSNASEIDVTLASVTLSHLILCRSQNLASQGLFFGE